MIGYTLYPYKTLEKLGGGARLSLSLRSFLLLTIFVLGLVLVVHSQSPLQIGYAVVTAAEGDALPVTSALFSSTNAAGVLIWEAGVAAVEPIPSGRIFVDQQGSTRTAMRW